MQNIPAAALNESASCAGVISQCPPSFPPPCLRVTGLCGTLLFFCMCHIVMCTAVSLHSLVQPGLSGILFYIFQLCISLCMFLGCLMQR